MPMSGLRAFGGVGRSQIPTISNTHTHRSYIHTHIYIIEVLDGRVCRIPDCDGVGHFWMKSALSPLWSDPVSRTTVIAGRGFITTPTPLVSMWSTQSEPSSV